jgi:hypothetical protein
LGEFGDEYWDKSPDNARQPEELMGLDELQCSQAQITRTCGHRRGRKHFQDIGTSHRRGHKDLQSISTDL